MKSLIIKPNSPYNVKSHFENYTSKEPSKEPQPCLYEGGVWWQALRLENKKLMPVEVALNENIDNPMLKVEIFKDTTESEDTEIINQIKHIFNTEYDLKPLYEFMDKDPILKKIKDDNYGLLPAGCYPSIYEAVISVIVQQQISLKIAFHMISLIIQKLGDCIQVGDKTFWAFPTPSKIANTSISDLRTCKISGRKAEYIRDFSKVVANRTFDLESLKNLSHRDIVERLMQFRGLGRWTSEMVIVTSIGLNNVNPAGDLGARKAISHFYNNDKLMSENEVRTLTSRWGKYKGIITYYCIAEALH